MSITFKNVNFDWDNIKKNKHDWIRIIIGGTLTSIIFNIWLLAPNLEGESIGYKITVGIAALGAIPTWGLAFSFAAGAVAKQADFVEQIIMMFIAAYLVALIGSLFPILFVWRTPAFIFFSFGFPFTLVLGFVPGFGISLLLDKYMYKTAEKGVKDKNYVNYSTLDDGYKM